MAHGLRRSLHVTRTVPGAVRCSHPGSGAWKAHCCISCVASYPSMRQEAAEVVGANSARCGVDDMPSGA